MKTIHGPEKNPGVMMTTQHVVTLHSWCHHKAFEKDRSDSNVSVAERWTD